MQTSFDENQLDQASHITKREREVLFLIGRGKTTKEIATELRLSPETVSSYRKVLCTKLGLHSTASLVAFAAKLRAPPI